MMLRLGLLLALIAAAVVTPAVAAAQSLFASRGLGYVIDADDARARGLGGVGIGLPGFDATWANPASAVGLDAPTFVFGYQYDNFTAEARGFTGRSARFPLLLGAFPVGERVVLQAGFGGFLDQNWIVEQQDTLIIAGDSVPILDRATAEGGVGRFRIGAGYQVSDRLGFSLATDLYTGEIERIQGRIFPPPYTSVPVRGVWTYRGLGYTGGVHWTRGTDAAAGVAVTVGGRLEAQPGDTVTAAGTRTYDLPVIVRGGGSGRVFQNTLLAVSGTWAGWSGLDEALAEQGGAADSWTVEGGVEWDAMSLRDRPLPVRVGARAASLPFRWDAAAAEAPQERALSFGAGLVLAGGATRSDIAFELGNRGGDAAGLDESFWRFNFSVRVLAR